MAAAKPLSVFEVYDRFQNGKKVREEIWDYSTIPENAAAFKEKYKLRFGKNVIPEDKDIKNRLFNAGVEMLVETGFFNPDIGRVMYITESEIFEGLKRSTKRLRLGTGREEVICGRRHGNSSVRPVIQGGPTGTPVSEDVFVPMMQAYAQESMIDTLASGVMATIEGHPATANTPWEIKATLAEIRSIKEGMIRAGRPGMGIKGPDTPLSAAGRLISGSGSGTGLARNDLHLCSQLNELKMDMMGLNVIAGWASDGDTVMVEQMPMFGGYCGGIEETAICSVATTLASAALFDADIHLDGTINMSLGITTAREALQIAAHVAAAMDANTDMLLANQYYTAAGPCTEMCLFEVAAQAICDTASGRELISGTASAKGIARDKTTPLEAKMMAESSAAAAGMKVTEVNHILDIIIPMYSEGFPQPPKGKRFQDCYDLRTVTPSEEYLGIYDKTILSLKEIGLDIRY
ncbi:MAG: monomethylamine:corrinoid methyltransferase [Methanomassiliicoccaceae archaeon]|nr:monomethylamine:corrinoid methyltransferase [Methanomassiliicoccaceae archaeon]